MKKIINNISNILVFDSQIDSLCTFTQSFNI